MQEKVKQRLEAVWNLHVSPEMMEEIETIGFDRFMRSYRLQEDFSRKYNGFPFNKN